MVITISNKNKIYSANLKGMCTYFQIGENENILNNLLSNYRQNYLQKLFRYNRITQPCYIQKPWPPLTAKKISTKILPNLNAIIGIYGFKNEI